MISVLLAACAGSGVPDGEAPKPGLVARPPPGGEVGWPDVAIDEAGTVWVTWVSVDAEEHTRLWLAASHDAGHTFGAPALLEDGPLFLGTVRQPVIATHGDRVAVTVGGGSYLSSTILLFVVPVADPARVDRFELDAAERQGQVPSDTLTLVDQPEAEFDAAGELWVTWKRVTAIESVSMVTAREAEGFAVVALDDGERGQPCECCPVDLQVGGDGGWVMAYRNNDRNLRDIFLLDVDGGRASPVSDRPWRIGGCPFDGPALVGLGGGGLVSSWVDGTAGDNYAYVARSDDNGHTWSPSVRVLPDRDESMTWPTLARDDAGTVWLSVEVIFSRTRVLRSDDDGETFTEVPLAGPPLFFAELAAGAGAVGLAGLRDDGAVVYRRLVDRAP